MVDLFICFDFLNFYLELLHLDLPIWILNAEHETPLSCAARYGLEDMVLVLISEGADLTPRDRSGCSPLMRAAENGHMGVVMMLIKKQRESIKESIKFDPGWCLIESAYKGMESAVRVLLDAGVAVEAERNAGIVALVNAAAEGRFNIVSLLLDKGANINAAGFQGKHGSYECCWKWPL